MYSASFLYYDSLENDKIEYAASYRSLLWWTKCYQKRINIAVFLRKLGIESVSICGLNDIGKLLINELMNSDISIPYIIDDNPQWHRGEYDLPIKTVNSAEQEKKVQMIIITEQYKYNDRLREFMNFGYGVRSILSCEELFAFALVENKG